MASSRQLLISRRSLWNNKIAEKSCHLHDYCRQYSLIEKPIWIYCSFDPFRQLTEVHPFSSCPFNDLKVKSKLLIHTIILLHSCVPSLGHFVPKTKLTSIIRMITLTGGIHLLINYTRRQQLFSYESVLWSLFCTFSLCL